MSNPRKAPAWWSVWLLALTIMAAGGEQAHAWEVRDTLVAKQESLLENPAYEILVVTVLAVEATGATNGNPPKVNLRVEEVLRGADRDATVTADWSAPVFHEDTKAAGGSTEAWQARPLAGPEVGAKLIVFSIGPPETAEVLAWSVYRFSPPNRAVVLEHAATERSAKIQIPVFFLILALPFLIVILFVRSMSAKVSLEARRRLGWAVPTLAVLTLGLYVFYETGISAYSNIRIDLTLIWPAVGTALVIGVLALFRRRRRDEVTPQSATPPSGLLAVLGASLAWGIGTALVLTVVGILVHMLRGESGQELAVLSAILVAPGGLFIGSFMALLFQIRRVYPMPIGSKTAYGLLLLVLLFPFFGSILSVSSILISMSASLVEVSSVEQKH